MLKIRHENVPFMTPKDSYTPPEACLGNDFHLHINAQQLWPRFLLIGASPFGIFGRGCDKLELVGPAIGKIIKQRND